MTAATQNITIYKGVAFSEVYILTLASTGAAMDISLLTPYAVARSTQNGLVVFDLGPEVTDGAAGEITIALTTAEVLALPEGTFYYDLTMADVTGERTGPYMAGTVTVTPLYTRP